jgi:hypothetical protein
MRNNLRVPNPRGSVVTSISDGNRNIDFALIPYCFALYKVILLTKFVRFPKTCYSKQFCDFTSSSTGIAVTEVRNVTIVVGN